MFRATASIVLAGFVFFGVAHGDEAHRLGDDVVPLFQSVELTVDPRESSFDGSVAIDVRVERSTNEITLHAEGPDVSAAAVFVRGDERRRAVAEPEGNDRVVVRTDTPLPAGTHRIELSFTAPFDTQAVALYRTDFEGAAYAFTQFQATEARKTFPCFDEPAFKIPWKVTLTVPDGHLAFSNTPVEAETELESGDRRYEFARTRAMPSYLVALAVGPFDVVPVPGLGYPGNIIVPTGKADLAAEAVSLTPVLLHALEEYFGTPYPYKKLDQVAVPEFWAGAMENVGLITYRDTILLKDSARLTPGERRYLITVITHELAHMWFGNLVTMEWWDDLWLNEAFATWMATKIDTDLFPGLDFDIDRVEEGQQAMQIDGQESARAVRQPVTSAENLLQAADALAYDKGRMVLGMFERWMGEDAFREGVRTYLTAHRWGNARAADLWEHLSQASGVDVGAAMGTFLDQPGVPVVDVDFETDGTIALRQRRHFNGGDRDDDTLWQIPMRIKFADDRGTHVHELLLSERERTLTLPAVGDVRWVHPNADETGYYRWRLSGDGFLDLTRVTGDLEATEELALVSAATLMLDTERMSGSEYLAAIKRLGEDPRAQSISGLLGALSYVDDVFIDAGTEDAFATYVRSIVEPIHARYGEKKTDDEHPAITGARSRWMSTLGRLGQSPAISAFAAKHLDAFMKDPTSVDPSLAGLVLRESARHGDDALFDRFVEKFQTAEVPSDRIRFLRTLGAFEAPDIRARALRFALETPLPPQHVLAIPMAISDRKIETRHMMWGWMTENYDTIASKIPPPFLQYAPYWALTCDGSLLEAAEEFFADPAHNVPGTDVEFAKVRQSVEVCRKLADRESSSVRSYLRELHVEG